MKLQFYETMEDKSNEYLSYLIEQILPKFTKSELQNLLENSDLKPTKGKKATSSKGYVKIGDDKGKNADLSKLTKEQLKNLFQIFISRERNDKSALKWRFYQYIRYKMDLNLKSVKVNHDFNPDRLIDFIIETEENDLIYALCFDILELANYNKAITKINDYAKKQNLIPDKVIFATGKSFRNIPIDVAIKIINKEILPELWVELTEDNRPFNKEDLLIVNNSDLRLAGFNFTNTDDLLNYVFRHSKGGQISIYKQFEFFTETSEDDPEVELIWKGIMLK